MRYETKTVPIKDIQQDADRYRKELGDLKSLAVSIHKYGLLNPITVDKNLRLIAGERRLTACRDYLKWTEITVRVPSQDGGEELDELAKIEMEVIENSHRKDRTFAEECEGIRRYHKCAVAKVGEAVKGKGAGWGVRDTAIALGVSVGTVSEALALASAIEKNPELAEAESKTAALKQMKRAEEVEAQLEVTNAIKQCGFTPDCLKFGENLPILREWGSTTIAYVNADPPYGIKYGTTTAVTDRWGDVYAVEDIPHEIFNNLELVLKELARILIPGGHGHLWFHMQHYSTLFSMLQTCGFEVNPVPYFWVKSRHGGGISKTTHSVATEPAFHFWKGTPRPLQKSGVLNYATAEKVPDHVKIHPTEKPVSLYRQMVELCSAEGEPCLDPYAGSAAFLRACLQLNRQPFGIEMKKEHYDAAVAALVKEMSGLNTSTKKEEKKGEALEEI